MRIISFILLLSGMLYANLPFHNLDQLPVVFLHGIGAGNHIWYPALKKVSVHPDSVSQIQFQSHLHYYVSTSDTQSKRIWLVGYYTSDFLHETLNSDLTTFANRLTRVIDEIKYITRSDRVIIIAHSMGGLIARKYMTLSRKNWQSVDTLFTLGSPHEGVVTSIPVVGQLRDLFAGSDFLENLDKDWQAMRLIDSVQWVSVAAVKPYRGLTRLQPKMTDLAGPGYVSIYSALPYGEWKTVMNKLDVWIKGDDVLFYKLLVIDDHVGMLIHPKMLELFQSLLF